MGFWGPQTCPWLKIVANFFFLGGATDLKIWDLAPRPYGANTLTYFPKINSATELGNPWQSENGHHHLSSPRCQNKIDKTDFLRRPKGRRSNIALDLQFMQIFTNQKYS